MDNNERTTIKSFQLQEAISSLEKVIKDREDDRDRYEDQRRLYSYAKNILETAEDLELAGIDHSDAMMISTLLHWRNSL